MKELLYSMDVVDGFMDNGILVVKFKEKKFDLNAAKITVTKRLEVSKGTAYPILIDASEVQSISKEARDYFASTEGISLIQASALLLDSVMAKFLGNFFLTINKPKVPTKIFTSSDDAMVWLQQFKKKK
jgi:hypothetical protein